MATKKVKTIGKYSIIKTLKKGGMGVIFLAKHPTLNRLVVIKKLTFRGNREIKERFKREAELMMDLKSEYIVNVYDHFKVGATHYLVQEYIDGLSLDDIIKRDGKLSSIDTSIIAFDIAKALKYIHEKGIIHRDIKPGNILIDKRGHSKLTDFGIASLGEDDEIDSTSTLEFLGTPTYMPPEQIDNFKDSDIKGDIYSYGVVIYEMLTGLKPFMGSVTPKLLKDIKKGRYYPVRKMNKSADRALCKVSSKSMNRNRDKRFKDFTQVIQSISKYLKRNRPIVNREGIAELVKGDKESSTSFRAFMDNSIRVRKERRNTIKRRVVVGLFSSVLIMFLTSLFYLGIPFRVMKSSMYGSMILKIESDEFPSRKSIKISDSNGSLVKKIYLLTPGIVGSFITSDINLKAGSYNITISDNGIKSVTSVDIIPYSQQKYNLVQVDMNKNILRPINLTFNFKDRFSKKDITKSVIYYYKELKPGEINEIIFKSPGFYNKKVIVDLDSDDRELYIQGDMIPLRGKFQLDIDSSNYYTLRVNNQSYYIQGGDIQGVEKLTPFNSSIGLFMNPGTYKIDLITNKEVVKEWEVTIISDKITRVSYP